MRSIFVLVILLHCAAVKGNVSLVFNYDDEVCLREEVTFTCNVTGVLLEWILTPTSGPAVTEDFTRNRAATRDLSVGGVMFEATGGGTSPILLSTLSTTITSQHDGMRVTCVDAISSSRNETTIQVTNDIPSMPLNLEVVHIQNGSTVASVTLQWDPPSDNGGSGSITYNVTVPGVISRDGISGTSVTIDLPYNTPLTVIITATNCAGVSPQAVAGPFMLAPPSNCGFPRPPVNGSLGNISSTLEGSMVTFQCNEGLFPTIVFTAVCTSDGRWSPDPGERVCSVGCTPPGDVVNGYIGDVNSTTVVFGCNDGYSPDETMTAVCVGGDTWRPDPAQLMCTPLGIQNVRTCEQDTLSTGAAVATASVICSVVFFISGVVFAIGIQFVITKCRTTKKQTTRDSITSSVGSESPKPVPVYEDIIPTSGVEEQVGIELKENVAYGPVRS